MHFMLVMICVDNSVFLKATQLDMFTKSVCKSLLCMHDLLDSLAIGNKELTLNKQVGAFA